MHLNTSEITNHSRNIKVVKFILVILVSVLVISVLISPLIKSKHENLHMVFGDNDIKESPEESSENDNAITKITMPKFYGIDLKERPFTIDADEGIQIDDKNAQLKNVYGDIKLDSKDFVELKSSKAFINLENKNLKLKDNVQVKLNNNYVIDTNESDFSPNTGVLKGKAGISVKNERTRIIADQYNISNDFNTIKFSKNVKMTIHNE